MLIGIKEVVARQYDNYIKMSKEELAALHIPTSGARLHNIDAEQVMGMFSAAISRAPSATISHIASKIAGKKNYVLGKLRSNPPSISFVKLVVKLAGKRRCNSLKDKKTLMKKLAERVAIKSQKKEKAMKSKLEKVLKQLFNENASINDYQTALPNYSVEVLETVRFILDGRVVSHDILQKWDEHSDTSIPKLYNGKIEKVALKTNKKAKYPLTNTYTVCYWRYRYVAYRQFVMWIMDILLTWKKYPCTIVILCLHEDPGNLPVPRILWF
uniref:Uncharacterized protein n=1 Tax=Capitella teleta TaxID=283909 RepID=X1ZQ66_CAPTE